MVKKSKSSLVSELIANKNQADSKKSRSRSCLLCQKRKQKCDHRLPSCTTCIKAGVQCIQPEKYSVDSPIKDEYTLVLERRIQYLESMIDDASAYKSGAFKKYKKLSPYIQADAEDSQIDSQMESYQGNEIKTQTQAQTLHEFEDSIFDSHRISDPEVKLENDSVKNPFDPGSLDDFIEIPTFSLMNDPMRQIPKLDNNGEMLPPMPPKSVRSTPQPTEIPSMSSRLTSIAGPVDLSKTIFSNYDFNEISSYNPEYDVDNTLSRTLIDTHFVRFQIKFPFLDEKEVLDFYNAYTTKNLTGYMNNSDYFYFSCCRQWLIYSLNAFILKTTGDYKHMEPLRFFSTALRSLSKCEIKNPTQQIEIYLLTILCLIRCDRDSLELYNLIGDAMKVAVSMNLHKYTSYFNCSAAERLQKMKSFWCVYLLDRLISVSLGKPFTIPEKDIDPDIPLFDQDPSKANYVHGVQENSTSVLFINQSIKLKRIEAKAIDTLNIVGTNQQISTSSELPLVEHYFDQLQDWRKECNVEMKDVEKATLGLYYFRTVRVLIQPYLELMNPEDRLLKECQAAAGQICQLFKVFHQKTVYGHSTLAINNVFVAGVTLIYCLWLTRNTEDKRRKLLGDTAKHTRPVMTAELFTSLDDLKACSICLFVMAERSKYAVVFRDTFERLLRGTIGNLIERCGPDSTELVYNTRGITSIRKPDTNKIAGEAANHVIAADQMPPAVVRRPVYHYEVIPEYNSFSNKNSSAKFIKEHEKELEENKRKRGFLERSAVPKSLSHLLTAADEAAAAENSSTSPQSEEKTSSGTEMKASNGGSNSSAYSGYTYGDLFNVGKEEPHEDPNSLNNGLMNNINFGFQIPSSSAGEIPFTDRANDMINNISTWTEESGAITSKYLHSLVGGDFTDNFSYNQENGDGDYGSTTNQIFADLQTLNTLAMNATNSSSNKIEEPPSKKNKFDTRNLFNGNFKINKSS